MAAMDETGYAHFSAVENLANRARISVEDTEKALECLMGPDPNSANPANDGRRVERVPGGFMILNADDHRKTLNREIRREQTRLRVAKHRALCNKESVTAALRGVTSASASVSSSGEGIVKGRPSSLAEVTEFMGSGAADFWDYYESNGWRVGRNAMKDWRAAARKWKRYETNRQYHSKSSDRNAGTLNQGKANQYKGIGRVEGVSNAERSATDKDAG